MSALDAVEQGLDIGAVDTKGVGAFSFFVHRQTHMSFVDAPLLIDDIGEGHAHSIWATAVELIYQLVFIVEDDRVVNAVLVDEMV